MKVSTKQNMTIKVYDISKRGSAPLVGIALEPDKLKTFKIFNVLIGDKIRKVRMISFDKKYQLDSIYTIFEKEDPHLPIISKDIGIKTMRSCYIALFKSGTTKTGTELLLFLFNNLKKYV